MKILLHINSLAVGGAESTVVKLARYWAKRGHDVAIVTQTPVATDQLPIPEGVSRYSTDTAGMSRNLVDAVLRNAKRFLRLRRLIRSWQPDLVIGFLPTANVQVLLAGFGLGIKTCVAERAYPAHLQLPPLQRIVRNLLYPRAAQVIVQTREGEAWYQAHLGLHNTLIIPNGISLPMVERSPRVPIAQVVPEHANVVLFVGRMAEPKCPETAVEAFVRAFPETSNWHLVLIGNGDKVAMVTATAARHGNPKNVHLLPDAGNTAEWYQRAAIFLSVSRFEGFPNVLLEAMAHGVVCIAWDCQTGPADIIQDGVNGYLLPVGDVQALTSRLQTLADDPVARERIGESARTVLDTFSDTRFYQAWDALLVDLN